jgi:putative ABC transport system permease protein
MVMLDGFFRDVAYAWRTLLRQRGFLIGAVATLALGVGTNTAMFGIVNAVLLAPLPYAQPGNLVSFNFSNRLKPTDRGPLSVADYQDTAPQLSTFASVAAYTDSPFTVSGDGEPEQVRGVWGTGALLTTLGVAPALGRTFVAADDAAGDDNQVVLSYELWQRRYRGSSDVLGRPILLNGRNSTVVGVMPRGFQFPLREATGMAGPVMLWIRHPSEPPTRRGPYYLWGVGRLGAGVSLDQAQAQLSTVAARIATAHPETNADWTLRAVPLKNAFVGSSRLTLYALFSATALVLLIAAANVSNLLLSRGTARRRELAIRVSQGAGPRHLLQQLLAEGALLAALGAVGGVLLAALALKVLVAIAPAEVPRLEFASIDAAVLAFNAVVAAVCAIGFGLLPARRATRMDAYDALRPSASSTATPDAGRLRRVLVGAEVALSFVVLVATGLLIGSLSRLQRVEPGVVQPEQVLSLQLDLPSKRYGEAPKLRAFYEQLLERSAALPGVISTGIGMSLPPNLQAITDNYLIEGQAPKTGNAEAAVPLLFVDAGYFTTLGIPQLRGRAFTASDGPDAPPVVIINAALAARHFPGQDPIGKRLKIGGPERPENRWLEIVGVVGNVRYNGVDKAAEPALYAPFRQNEWLGTYLLLRTHGDPNALIGPVRQMIGGLDGELAVTDIRTMRERFDAAVGAPRFRSLLFTAFGVLGLLLAAIGLYAVTATIVAERTREIGVRMALGARARTVVRGIVAGSLRTAAAGLVVGAIAALLITRLLRGLLFELSPLDPPTYAAAAALLLGTSLLAAWLPARRAALANPMRALQGE